VTKEAQPTLERMAWSVAQETITCRRLELSKGLHLGASSHEIIERLQVRSCKGKNSYGQVMLMQRLHQLSKLLSVPTGTGL
jgi:hypothetical protein